jgi:hypothetical protein
LSGKSGSNGEIEILNYAKAFIVARRALWRLPSVEKVLE